MSTFSITVDCLLCCLIGQLLWLHKKRPTRKRRLWQATLIGTLIVAILNLTYRAYPPAEKYVGTLFFVGIAVALPLWANQIAIALTRRKADHVSFALALAWLASAPAVFLVSMSCLLIGLGILFFLP